MSQIIKPDKEGALHLSSELLGPTPHARYIIERSGEVIVLRPLTDVSSFWATTSPEERAAAFRQWAVSHEGGPNLPDEALSRESIYD